MIQDSFNSGELTPLAHGRVDIPARRSACSQVVNFLPMPHGGVTRDPGLEFLKFLPDTGRSRLIPFEFSVDQRFVVVLSQKAAWVLGTSGVLTAWNVSSLVTPYAVTDLRDIQYAQINDLIFFTHPDHPPQVLARVGENSFTWSTYKFLSPPMLDSNPDPNQDITAQINDPSTAAAWVEPKVYNIGDVVTNSTAQWVCTRTHTSSAATEPVNEATYRAFQNIRTARNYVTYIERLPYWQPVIDKFIAPPGTVLELTSDFAFFTDDMVGETLELTYRRSFPSRQAQQEIPAGTTGTPVSATTDYVFCDGDFDIATTGNWTGRVKVQESPDLGITWNNILIYDSQANANYNESHSTAGPVLLRISVTSTGAVANTPDATLTVTDPFTRGLVSITSVETSTSATIQALETLRGRTPDFWSRAAFSRTQGYPSAVTIHRQRLYFAGTAQQPQKVWASALDAYDIFRRRELVDDVSDADSPFNFNIVSDQQNRIRFLVSTKELIAGTSAGEWIIAGDQQTGFLGPASYQVVPISNYGSSSIQPVRADIGIYFIPRAARSVRHIGNVVDVSYAAPEIKDTSILAEHLLRDGIVEHSCQRAPTQVYWAVTSTGNLIGHTTLPEVGVSAWHRREFADTVHVESVATVYSDAETEDQVWLALRHKQPDGSFIRTVERFSLGQTIAQENEAYDDFRFLHHHITVPAVKNVQTSAITSMGHLEGRELWVYLGGQIIEKIPASASFTITPPASGTMVIGCPYTSTIKTLPPVITARDGSQSFMTAAQIGRCYLLPYKSGPGEISTSARSAPSPWVFRSSATPLEDVPPLTSDSIQVDGIGGVSGTPSVTITTSGPFPSTLLAVNYAFQPTERL